MTRQGLKFRGSTMNGDARDERELGRRLTALEENVGAAFRRVEEQFSLRYALKATRDSAVTAKLGDLVSIIGPAKVTLPVATQANGGQSVAIHSRSGGGNITVIAQTAQTIDGLTTVGAGNFRIYWSAGDRWATEA